MLSLASKFGDGTFFVRIMIGRRLFIITTPSWCVSGARPVVQSFREESVRIGP